jgi:DNA polymerase-3 subunit epsilon/CBS domain-containing protein
MDQDNAIVYADPAQDDSVDGWFEELGRRTSDILAEIGVAYCKGGVMASNPAWRKSLSEWRTAIGTWLTRSRPADILNLDIFFDAAPAHGDANLAEELLSDARTAAGGAANFLKLLSLNAADFQHPRGLFGRLRQVDGRTDLKAGGIMPIFSAARVAALTHGIPARSTPERLRAAAEKGVASRRTVDNLIEAHAILLGLILRQQLADIDAGLTLGNMVETGALGGIERRQLGWALDQLPAVADIVGVPAV